MVDPMSESERDAGTGWLKALFVLVVTASAGGVAIAGGATTTQLLAALGGGFLVSLVLLWYVVRTISGFTPSRRRGRGGRRR
ncbi:hypothetical protein [Halopenitus sp. POP-27]|uniref:hypothetical protein n=1 Tax=Halopenitus sp. POP-27 TaxID=2994425 RepID=UPI0024693CC2|nr:hypothetical protein [Halopenitus sp. POP-27]